jgi:hypothetical protein
VRCFVADGAPCSARYSVVDNTSLSLLKNPQSPWFSSTSILERLSESSTGFGRYFGCIASRFPRRPDPRMADNPRTRLLSRHCAAVVENWQELAWARVCFVRRQRVGEYVASRVLLRWLPRNNRDEKAEFMSIERWCRDASPDRRPRLRIAQ